MNVQVGIDKVMYENKPDKYEIIKIKRRAVKNWQVIEVKELATLVSNGCAILPGHLINGLGANNCVGMQIFCLDFECGITFRKIKDRSDTYNIPILFAYRTYSSSEERERFRVVFVHNTLIEDVFMVDIIIQMLHKVFPESDGVCTNKDRLFLGGKELIYCNDNANIALVQLLSIFHSSIDKNKNYKKNLKVFCNKHKILMINDRAAMGDGNLLSTMELEVKDDFRDFTILHKIVEDTKSSFLY